MLETTWRENSTLDQAKVLLDGFEVLSDNLGMSKGVFPVFITPWVQATEVHVVDLLVFSSFRKTDGWHWFFHQRKFDEVPRARRSRSD